MTVRTARVVADYITGMPVEDIANREEVSQVRIYQILEKELRGLGYPKIEQSRQKPGLALWRLRTSLELRRYRLFEARTPEDFFYEILDEQRTITS